MTSKESGPQRKFPDTITLHKKEGVITNVEDWDDGWLVTMEMPEIIQPGSNIHDQLTIGIKKKLTDIVEAGQDIVLYTTQVVQGSVEQIFLDGKRIR